MSHYSSVLNMEYGNIVLITVSLSASCVSAPQPHRVLHMWSQIYYTWSQSQSQPVKPYRQKYKHLNIAVHFVAGGPFLANGACPLSDNVHLMMPLAKKVTNDKYLMKERHSLKIVFQQVTMRSNRRHFQAENVSPNNKGIVSFLSSEWVMVKQSLEQGELLPRDQKPQIVNVRTI